MASKASGRHASTHLRFFHKVSGKPWGNLDDLSMVNWAVRVQADILGEHLSVYSGTLKASCLELFHKNRVPFNLQLHMFKNMYDTYCKNVYIYILCV